VRCFFIKMMLAFFLDRLLDQSEEGAGEALYQLWPGTDRVYPAEAVASDLSRRQAPCPRREGPDPGDPASPGPSHRIAQDRRAGAARHPGQADQLFYFYLTWHIIGVLCV
jgi:hypothetical protein